MKNFIKRLISTNIIILSITLFNFAFVLWAEGWWNWGWNWGWTNGWVSFWNNLSIYTRDLWKVINTQYDWEEMKWPLNDWAYRIVNWDWGQWHISWLAGTEQEITDYDDALDKIINVIQNVVNYTLWLLWAIAVVYLLIHGFMILTAAWDDNKTKKWLKWIKNAFIAIVGIWLSWVIIRFILRIIQFATS